MSVRWPAFRRFTTAGFLLLILTVALTGRVQASDLAQSVISSSALDTVIEQYPQMITESITRGIKQTGGVDPMVSGAIQLMVGQAFNSRRIRAQVAASLDKELTPKTLTRVRDFYHSDLGARVAGLESAAALPSAWPQIESAGPALVKQYRGTERERLFDAFDQASRATENAVDTTIAVQTALGTAVAALRGQPANFDQVHSRVEKQRDMLTGLVEQQVYAAYLYTYKDLSDAQLKRYIQFLESEDGRQFSRVATGSLKQAILDPIQSISNGLNQLLSPADKT